MSKEELDKIIPVRPPNVNKKMNPRVHNNDGFTVRFEP